MKTLILILGVIFSSNVLSIGSCKYARSELDALSCVVYNEARGASKTDKIATAYVAMNRVNHPNFSDDLIKVIYRRHQFSWTSSHPKDLIPKNPEAWAESKRIAALVLDERIPDPTNGAVYFGKSRKPYMKRVTLKTGAHYYAK